MQRKVQLGVNIDHVATLRQVRKTYEPDPVWAAVEAQLGGADGITFHLREDRRHIQEQDVLRLHESCQVKLNMEMAPTTEMVNFALNIHPHMAMLVPEGRREITTEGGLDIVRDEKYLREIIDRLRQNNILTSVFIDADLEQIEAAAHIGAHSCEIHTGPFANTFHSQGRNPNAPAVVAEFSRIKSASMRIRQLGMFFNAGHGLNYYNVSPIAHIDGLHELHIGHAIVSRSIFVGMREAVREMKNIING